MLDLCKIFGVEEGEEFKFCEYGDIYFIQNGYLYFIDIDSTEKKSYLIINDVVGKNIIKLPNKYPIIKLITTIKHLASQTWFALKKLLKLIPETINILSKTDKI